MRRAAVCAAAVFLLAVAPAPARQAGEGVSPVARIVLPTVVRELPGSGRVLWRAAPRTPGGNATWLLVTRRTTTPSGEWIEVLTPLRPNGTTGWVDAERVELSSTPWRVEVSLTERRVRVLRSGHVVHGGRVVIGAPGTPTPTGRFALHDTIRQSPPGGFVGGWILPLTATSNVLGAFDGGPGRIAFHGRGGASLLVPLGSAASRGCIRVGSPLIDALARLPLGTPVVIRR